MLCLNVPNYFPFFNISSLPITKKLCRWGALPALQWLLALGKGSQILVWPGEKPDQGEPSLEPQSLWRFLRHGAHGGQVTVGHTWQDLAGANVCAVVLGKQTAQVHAWEQYRECFNKGKATAQLTCSRSRQMEPKQRKKKKDKDTAEKKNEKITCLERKAQEDVSGYDRKAGKGSRRLGVRQNKYWQTANEMCELM